MTVPNDSDPLTAEGILDTADDLLQKGIEAESHQAKIIALSNFLDGVFGVDIDDILPGVEKKIGSRILGLSGRIDLLYDNIVFEMKTDFDSERSDAITKLQDKYFPTLLEENPDGKYISLITDLRKFELVRPRLENGDVVDIITIDDLDVNNNSIEEILFWLDSALFSGSVKVPSADELKRKYGPGSPTYELAVDELTELWEEFSEENPNDTRLDLWGRMMEIVYGDTPDKDAFVAQTYLSVLVKILVRLRLSPAIPTTKDEYIDVINGDFFEDYGISNLVEEDFYTWILDKTVQDETLDIFIKLARALNVYDIELAREDLFKEVYQEIVGLNQRHGTGEYYTPRWLCEYTLQEALEQYNNNPGDLPRLLDPACGSGGFLTEAIHHYLESSESLSDKERVDLITDKIQGIDVNPLAVIIARSNYVIALGDLLQSGQEIIVPIFASDSINLPDLRPSLHGGVNCYAVEAEEQSLMIPQSIAEDGNNRMEVLNTLGEATRYYRGDLTQEQAISYFERKLPSDITDAEVAVLKQTLRDLIQFVDAGKDHIWVYVLNNFYAPTLLRSNPFDLLIGNPPWIVMRSISNEQYQDFLKSAVNEYNLLDSENINLYTHMEMATLFFRKTSDVYLETGGQIAFLMPIGVTSGALQHQKFNQFDTPEMKLRSVRSFRGVSEIFSLPPCILFAEKGDKTEFPVELIEWSGSISNLPRNTDWGTVESIISSKSGEYTPAKIPTDESPYYDEFREGATLNPRNLFYVDFADSTKMGISANRPLLRTSEDVAKVAGKKWEDIILEDRVESEFLHASYLGKDMIPFGTLPPRPVVLPSIIENGNRLVLQSEGLRNRGFPLVAEWLDEAEKHWKENRTDKSEDRFPSVVDRIDYHGYLSNQDPEKRYVVAYNGRGADSFASVIDRHNLESIRLGNTEIQLTDFIADQTNYYYETNDLDEAHYLCAILNSHEIHEAVKPFQPEGAYGYRDIGRRPFKLPIPEYDQDDATHVNLAELSKEGHSVVENIDFDPDDGFRRRRNITDEVLEDKGVIDRIDKVVLSLGITGASVVEAEE